MKSYFWNWKAVITQHWNCFDIPEKSKLYIQCLKSIKIRIFKKTSLTHSRMASSEYVYNWIKHQGFSSFNNFFFLTKSNLKKRENFNQYYCYRRSSTTFYYFNFILLFLTFLIQLFTTVFEIHIKAKRQFQPYRRHFSENTSGTTYMHRVVQPTDFWTVWQLPSIFFHCRNISGIRTDYEWSCITPQFS